MWTFMAQGAEFDVERFLLETGEEVDWVWHAGEPRGKKRVHRTSGFIVQVSELSFDDPDARAAEAEDFLTRDGPFVRRVMGWEGVTHAYLHGGAEQTNGPLAVRIPPGLVAAAGHLGIGLVMTWYAYHTPNENLFTWMHTNTDHIPLVDPDDRH